MASRVKQGYAAQLPPHEITCSIQNKTSITFSVQNHLLSDTCYVAFSQNCISFKLSWTQRLHCINTATMHVKARCHLTGPVIVGLHTDFSGYLNSMKLSHYDIKNSCFFIFSCYFSTCTPYVRLPYSLLSTAPLLPECDLRHVLYLVLSLHRVPWVLH